MEDVINLYEKPYDADYPVLCFDERPCQLIGDVLIPLPMKPHQPRREHYAYKRNGICYILIAFEPLAGKRFVEVSKRRTKRDYARFMETLAREYAMAKRIILIQDNLNTHNPSSFYESFRPERAFELSQCFEMHYTPKRGSWLNMVEIELSALSKQCLDRRIGDMGTLERELLACVRERNHKKATVNWQFSKNNARDKFRRYYKC